MDQYVLLYPEQVNICESSSLCDPNQGIFADNGYSPTGGPLLIDHFTDLYPASNATAALNLLSKINTPGQLNKKMQTNYKKRRKREEEAKKIGCYEAFKKSNKIKDEAMTANDEDIAMLKENLPGRTSRGMTEQTK